MTTAYVPQPGTIAARAVAIVMDLPDGQSIANVVLAELREECFRMDRIQREVDELATARGWPPQSIAPAPWKRGRWPQPARLTYRAAVLIGAVHARLLEETDA